MNTKILQKCIDELKKDKPSIERVLGMLETLVEMVDVVVIKGDARSVIEKPVFGGQTETARGPYVEDKKLEVPVVKDPAGDMETPEQRKARLGTGKVPPAFLGDIRRMHLDPAKTDGKTDVTPSH